MKNFWVKLIPKLNNKIWLLTFGRLLSQIGSGFTLFYAPIFFVNEVGLTATAVGIALGSGSIAGIIGRFLGGGLLIPLSGEGDVLCYYQLRFQRSLM